MPSPGTRTAIFIQRGVEPRKQAAACMGYIEDQRWDPVRHVVPYHAPEAAVALVEIGEVDVIVTAYDSRAAQALAADVGSHGQVVYVHPQPTVIEPPERGLPSLVSLVLRWARRGRTPKEIAAELETDTSEIRDIIRKRGRGHHRSD